jgi:6-phosphogluconolactonase
MEIRVLPDPEQAARAAAAWLAEEARRGIATRGRFTVALSGGRTPWRMLECLAAESLDWQAVDVLQVDERFAPDGDDARNLIRLEPLLAALGLPSDRLHPMSVGREPRAAIEAYEDVMRRVAGVPPVLDVVHLGLGADGHTASLVPGDPVLGVRDRDVACTGPYQGHRRLTLTLPAIDRARRRLWLVTGADKAPALARLRRADPGIPAGRVRAEGSLVIADAQAMGERESDAGAGPP